MAVSFTGAVEDTDKSIRLQGTIDFGGPSQPVAINAGVVILPGLPAADPHVVGQLWNNAGALTVSAG